MKRGRFDECCPHCSKKIGSLNDFFVCADYQTDFTFECPHCCKEIQCDVHTVPEFELRKAETPEEYADKLKLFKEAVR